MVNNKIEKIETLVLTDLNINEVDFSRNLILNFPPNIQVSDTIKGRVFKTLESGKMEDFGELKQNKPPNLIHGNTSNIQYTGPSIEEPYSNIYWYSAGFSLLVILFGLWYYFKK